MSPFGLRLEWPLLLLMVLIRLMLLVRLRFVVVFCILVRFASGSLDISHFGFAFGFVARAVALLNVNHLLLLARDDFGRLLFFTYTVSVSDSEGGASGSGFAWARFACFGDS